MRGGLQALPDMAVKEKERRSRVPSARKGGCAVSCLQGVPGGSSRAVPFPLPAGYLKPRAEAERRAAAEEKKRRDELKRIERELAEGTGADRTDCPHPDVLDGHQLLATCVAERGRGRGSRGAAAGPDAQSDLQGRGHRAGV